MKKIKPIFGCIIVLMAIAISTISCKENRVYDRFMAVSMDGWERNDTLKFLVDPQVSGNYQLALGLRATQRYPYKNVCMIIKGEIFSAKNKKRPTNIFSDTINKSVIDNRGLLVGKKGMTSTEISYPIRTLHLNEKDSLKIEIFHIMAREQLTGFSDVGVRLTKVGG